MDDSIIKIIVALIGLSGTVLGIIVTNISKSRKQAIEDALREENQNNLFKSLIEEMQEIKQRLDKHNKYAEKFASVEKSIIAMQKDIEYLRKGKKDE